MKNNKVISINYKSPNGYPREASREGINRDFWENVAISEF